jgi:hypothetical protein
MAVKGGKLKIIATFEPSSQFIFSHQAIRKIMEQILPYLINSAVGAGGGFLGNLLKKNGLGMVGNLLAGAVGGNALPMIAQAVMGGGDSNNMIMGIITSLIGGSAGSLLGGLFKKAA